MKKRWEMTKPPELVPHYIDQRHYNLMIDEIAEILVKEYCQLIRSSKKVRQSTEIHHSK